MDYSAALKTVRVTRGRAGRAPRQPLDASALDPASLENWQAEFHWPVSDAAFDAFAREAAEGFVEAARSLGGSDSQLLLSDTNFFGFLLQHLHLKAAAAGFGATGAEGAAGPITAGYLDPDWAQLARAFDEGPGLLAATKLRLRGLAKSWLFNRHLPLPERARALRPGCPVRVLGSFTPLMVEYAATAAAPARHVYAETAAKGAPRSIGGGLREAVRNFLAALDGAAKGRLGIGLDVDGALGCWVSRLSSLKGLAAAVRAGRATPEQLLLSNIGNARHRLLAQVWRERGAEVIGFHHGNEMGSQPNFLTGLMEYGLCDTFVAPTAKSAKWLRWVHEGGPTIGETRFVSAETGRYRALHRALGGMPPKVIKRVMIVAFPLSWIRYPGYTAHYALLQLDLELRLARWLKANGYEVIVKVHPEWQRLSEKLWRGRADRLPGDAFERSWTEADAFVFPRVSSTAFGFALCTDRPIIILDPPDQQWNPEALALLRRRCRFVPSRLDDSNRLRFNGDELIAALAEPPPEIDYSYVKQAMYPIDAGAEP